MKFAWQHPEQHNDLREFIDSLHNVKLQEPTDAKARR